MRPFSFQFKEVPTEESFDNSLLEYDDALNLSVDKITKLPAINELNLVTETFTRQNEDSDSDPSRINMMMATTTETKSNEGSDTDPSAIGLVR